METGRGQSSGVDENQALCMNGCPNGWLADKVCDIRCQHEDCG